MTSSYEVPSWAGKPPTGLHLDVLKENKLIQKLMIDQKKCYLFGRNSQLNDFCIDHASCSRVHAALVYHKHLNRAFLVDLGSTHGTYIGSIRLEANKPTQLPIDSRFHFGASTRLYIIRERPQAGPRHVFDELEKGQTVDGRESKEGRLLGLPESENDLDNLTEFNTAHNRRITMLGIVSEPDKLLGKKRKTRVTFNEDEEVINPEDVDPQVGRFRNLVETTVIPRKRAYNAGPGYLATKEKDTGDHKQDHGGNHHLHPHAALHHPRGLYDGLDPVASSVFSSKLGLPLPNPAPDVDADSSIASSTVPQASLSTGSAQPMTVQEAALYLEDSNEPKKKKYAKEAWPGRKPNPSLLG